MALQIHKKKILSRESEIPTASLADIVFLLLIFFLVTTSMNPDKGLGLTLPPPGEETKRHKEDILPIFINSAGKMLIREDIVSLNEIKEIVKGNFRKNPKLVISLIIDVNAEYRYMVDVLDEIKLAFDDLKKENPDFKESISLATPAF